MDGNDKKDNNTKKYSSTYSLNSSNVGEELEKENESEISMENKKKKKKITFYTEGKNFFSL